MITYFEPRMTQNTIDASQTRPLKLIAFRNATIDLNPFLHTGLHTPLKLIWPPSKEQTYNFHASAEARYGISLKMHMRDPFWTRELNITVGKGVVALCRHSNRASAANRLPTSINRPQCAAEGLKWLYCNPWCTCTFNYFVIKLFFRTLVSFCIYFRIVRWTVYYNVCDHAT